jgi:hypothetical protein
MVEGEYHDDAQAGDDPAVAFDRLRGEVALLRRAVADMAAARTSIEIPNYQPTLERTEKVLGLLAQQVDGVRKSPAMQITPETLGDRVNASVTKATSELRSLVQSSKSSLDGATAIFPAWWRRRGMAMNRTNGSMCSASAVWCWGCCSTPCWRGRSRV